MASQITVSLFLLAGLVITTPQGTLVPTATTQSFVTGPHTATTMIVSALHPSNTGNSKAQLTFYPQNVNVECTVLDNGGIKDSFIQHYCTKTVY